MADSTVVKAQLGDQRTVLIEARKIGAVEEDVGVRKLLSFEGVDESIKAISESVFAAIEKIGPSSAAVEFGIDVTLESGALTGMLAKGSGTATLKVTLNWGGAGA